MASDDHVYSYLDIVKDSQEYIIYRRVFLVR